MNKFIYYSRYVLCLPVAFAASILISGVVSVLQNLLNMLLCNFMFVIPYFVNCSGNYSKRTFLADVVFFYLLVTLSSLIAPKYKEQISLIVLILCIILCLLAIVSSLMKLLFVGDILNLLIIIAGLLIWGSVIYKNIQKNK